MFDIQCTVTVKKVMETFLSVDIAIIVNKILCKLECCYINILIHNCCNWHVLQLCQCDVLTLSMLMEAWL